MPSRIHKTIFPLIWLGVFLGCQADDEPLVSIATPTVPPPAIEGDSSQPDLGTGADGLTKSDEVPLAGDTYQPPFPDRLDLFVPVKREQVSVRSDDDDSDDSVQLQGFANVGEPRAILAFDGVVSPIAVGQEKYGIRVISIDKRSVVLQRGRTKWTETLE